VTVAASPTAGESQIAELAEDRVVEGVYAVASKRRLRTRSGSAYLALELVDRSGRMQARVWSDVELLDRRFREGDAVRVLARVERFRDRLQLDVRSLERADADPASLVPDARRDLEELDGFFDFLVEELAHPGLRRLVEAFARDGEFRARLRTLPATPDAHHSYAGGLLEHTIAVATLCREACELHPRLRRDLLVAAALLHDAGRTIELERGPLFRATLEGKLLGHVHLGLRLLEQRANGLEPDVLAELLHAVATHHDARSARTAEALVLVHANGLDAAAATRPVETG
jgi:3'-5' exoribonuclease